MKSWSFRFSSILILLKIEVFLLLTFCVKNYYLSFLESNTHNCDSTNSSIVRKLVKKNWNAVLSRYGVALPLECPLHAHRDLYGVRERIKHPRSSHWECRKCGKKFYHEHYLDMHLQLRHSEIVNEGEDSVCLGNYCDIMRCDVLKWSSYAEEESKSTDISVWVPHSNKGQTKAIPQTPFLSKHILERQKQEKGSSIWVKNTAHSQVHLDQCNNELFSNLKTKCSDLIWNCLKGLISTLDAKDFRTIQDELEYEICSFLSCSRYTEVSSQMKARGPFLIVFGSLLISLCLALAYYFAWIYSCSPTGEHLHQQSQGYNNQYLNKGQPNHTLVNRTTHI